MDWRMLFNPLAVLGKWRGLVTAVLVVIILGVAAYWGGVHIGEILVPKADPKAIPISMIAFESLIAWLSLAILFFAASKMLRGNGGFGAYLAAAGLGRFPYVFAVVILSNRVLGGAMQRVLTSSSDGAVLRPQEVLTPGLLVGILGIFATMAWAIVILYLGFKESSKLSGGRVTIGFAIGMVIAEGLTWLVMRAI